MTHIVGQRSSIVTQSVDPRWPSYDESEVTITSCSKHEETTDVYPTVDEIGEGYVRQIEGTHNQHIIALSALLKLRYSGFLESHDLLVLKNLKRNPLITAILARVDDGNQAETIAYLEKFPRDLPLETGWESWGGCPQYLYFFIVKAVIDAI